MEKQTKNNMEKQNELGIAGFTVSLLSLLVFPLWLGILGLVLSLIGLSNEIPKKGLAAAGLIISIVSIIFGVIKGASMGLLY